MASDYEQITRDNIRRRGEEFDDIGKFIAEKLYSDQAHFVYELLQNAEDAMGRRARAEAGLAFPRQVTFRLFSDRLELSHFGEPFSLDDVRGICDVLRSTSSGDATRIGRFGIDFKSVYAFTEAPIIHSGDEHFRIEHYIRPAGIPPAPIGDGETRFVFPFKRSDAFAEIRERLMRLGPQTLLFLRQIKEVVWEIEGKQTGFYLREDVFEPWGRRAHLLGTSTDGESEEEWLIFEREVATPGGAQPSRVEAAFSIAPDKRTGAPSIVSVKHDSHLVVYFPTEKETHLGFLAQGPYQTTPARDNIVADGPEGEWNARLIGETAILVGDVLPRLRDMGLLTISLLNALPINRDDFEQSPFHPMFDRVRTAFREQPLLPADDGTFVAAGSAKLARGTELRELLSEDQLQQLFESTQPLKWVVDGITADQTPALDSYLRKELEVEEVDPGALARRFSLSFVEQQPDEWLARFYGFLLDQKAIWRPRSSWQQPGIMRTKPFVRLQDGSHVLPFDTDGSPIAYLPSDEESGFPTVKREIAENGQAREFLVELGLSEPDLADVVIDKILPAYTEDRCAGISEREHERHLRTILRAMGASSGARKRRLSERLLETAFLLAVSADRLKRGYVRPGDVYIRSQELELYFGDNPGVWFLDEPGHDVEAQTFSDLGVHNSVEIRRRPADFSGYVALEDERVRRWYHRRGLNRFDPSYHVDRLAYALAHSTIERSRYIWNKILVPNSDCIYGTVESSTRLTYEGATQEDIFSEAGKLAMGACWLPSRDGTFHESCDLYLEDLPDDFIRDDRLASALGMRPTAVKALAEELGLDVEDLTFVRERREEFERWKQEVRRREERQPAGPDLDDEKSQDQKREGEGLASQDPGAGAPDEDELSGPELLDYRAELQVVFERPGQSPEDYSHPRPGPIPNPEQRRERTAADIVAARYEEPSPAERFQVVPRKRWEQRNYGPRQFLLEQYRGRCQICHDVFLKRDGQPYFEGLYLVRRTKARWVDRPGNVLCLCATCSAKFQYGPVEADDVIGRIEAYRTRREGGDDELRLQVRLCGASEDIVFTERHAIDLQAILGEEKDPN